MLRKIQSNPILLALSLLAIALIILLILIAMTNQPDLDDGAKVPVRIDRQRVTATVAAAKESQAKGLGGTQPLTDKQGMLFVYDEQIIPIFIMKDMTYPIDIIWINGNTVTDVSANVQPEPGVAADQLKKYSPPGPIDKVLEVNAGFAARYNIQPGDPVKITSF